MLCDAFEQTLALARGTAAGPAASPSAPAARPHGGAACADAAPTDVPPGLTAEERIAWVRVTGLSGYRVRVRDPNPNPNPNQDTFPGNLWTNVFFFQVSE